jgi:hypothetical protein
MRPVESGSNHLESAARIFIGGGAVGELMRGFNFN